MRQLAPAAMAMALLTAGCAAQPPGTSPAAAGWPAAGPDLHFEPHGLYGYIDGGAELFLEFGFASLDIRQVLVPPTGAAGAAGVAGAAPDSQEIDVELYHMSDPAAALGIYLAKCGAEKPRAAVAARNTGNAYQLTAVKGSLFLQVNNFSGDTTNLDAMDALAAEALAGETAAAPLAIWRHLPAEGRVPGSEFLFRGRFGLEPIYTFGPGDVLLIEGRALGAGARYAAADGTVYRRLTVAYADAGAAQQAMAHLQANLDPYLEVLERAPSRLVFKDYAGLYGRVERVAERLDIAVRLSARP